MKVYSSPEPVVKQEQKANNKSKHAHNHLDSKRRNALLENFKTTKKVRQVLSSSSDEEDVKPVVKTEKKETPKKSKRGMPTDDKKLGTNCSVEVRVS